ncbi:trimeric intracellular cation channel family protein [Desulfurobacterium atlanticum]|uniref:Uncharacterized membrane protein YeiH n=1 Tax=Desulfurobacterium atlanticum TaxID=240169 RepID=A0A238Z3X2_9BACT|nr:trimeric intracellular cation channel family protein [Desulfurobacterium atlanticum]SNR77581.1 Uncharacterized membrane protein YeiH [Desulfurobacterium atlanticum]
MTLFDFFNIIGLVAFAVSGVYKGIKKELDILGISILGFLTAFGGGILRDIIINRIPVVLTGYMDISFATGGIIAGMLFYKIFKKDISTSTTVKIFDAIGLAAFTISGAIVGINAGLNLVGVILLAVLTGTGGGMISDILTGEVPFILKEDVYATCSIAGAFILFTLTKTFGFSPESAGFFSLIFTMALRLTAIYKNWHLPRFE